MLFSALIIYGVSLCLIDGDLPDVVVGARDVRRIREADWNFFISTIEALIKTLLAQKPLLLQALTM